MYTEVTINFRGAYDMKQYLYGLTASILFPLLAIQAEGLTIYVTPDGNDAWSGRLEKQNRAGTDGPLASPAGARDAVRRMRTAGTIKGKVEIVFAGGTYQLKEPLILTPEDSGTEKAPVFFKAAKRASPVISGGRKITGFKTDSNGIWSATIPDAGAGKWKFEQLYVNGRFATRARTPDNSYYRIQGMNEKLPKTVFIANPADIAPLRNLSPEQLSDVDVYLYHAWECSIHHIESLNQSSSEVTIAGETPWPIQKWGKNQRYHLENFKDALDEPGEWFLDRDGTLYYKPMPGQDPATSEVIAPAVPCLVRLAGDAGGKRPVENITFDSLGFMYTGNILPPKGHADHQAAVTVGATIEADNARKINIINSSIGCIGNYGIWFHSACRDSRVEKTSIREMGAGGIKIGHGWELNDPNEQQITRNITVNNCIIHKGGRIFRGAIGSWIGHSSDNTITHNDIGDLFYTAVSVGWRWGYAPSVAKRNIIRFNRLHHIGQRVLSDMGGVYTLGPSEGTVVSDNVIHDVYAFDYGGWGLYTDEGSTGIIMENNLVYNVKTGCFHQHYGRENIIRNNIFAFSQNGQIQRSRTEPHLSFTFCKNLVYWNGGPLLTGNWAGDRSNYNMDSNLYCEASGAEIKPAGNDFKAWQAKTNDVHSLIANPLFVDPGKYDFNLKRGSPARKIGFKSFDFNKAGVYGEKDWIKLADEPMPTAKE